MFLSCVDPSLYYSREAPVDGKVTIEYLGTAGFVLKTEERVVVLDPFLTRPGILKTLFCKLDSDSELIRRAIPRADDVLIGHSHHDHILDAPELCHQTGARLIGSHSTRVVGRAAGLPEEQLIATSGGEDIACGETTTVRGFASFHGKVMGRVPLPGDIPELSEWPVRFTKLRHGLVLDWLVTMGGIRIMHIDSADFVEEELAGIEVDVLCLCAVGWQSRPDYVRKAIELLRPRFVIPCHWDWFFRGYEKEPRCLPGVALPQFVEAIEKTGATSVVLPLGAEFAFG